MESVVLKLVLIVPEKVIGDLERTEVEQRFEEHFYSHSSMGFFSLFLSVGGCFVSVVIIPSSVSPVMNCSHVGQAQ